MSILSRNQNITPEWLRANGWKQDGWGSLSWRKKHNATIWCKIYTFESGYGRRHRTEVIWFPKDFEGYVTGYGCDAKGMVFFNIWDSASKCPKMKCEDIHDLTTFISSILAQLKKDPYKFI